MATQYVFVASTPGQTLQPAPYVGSSSIGYSTVVSAELWNTSPPGSSSALPVSELGLRFGAAGGEVNPPPAIIAYNGKALFSAGGLWETDGTPLGTQEISTATIGALSADNLDLQPADFTRFGGKILYVAFAGPFDLVLSDGTAAGTQPIGGSGSSGLANGGVSPHDLTVLGGVVLFSGYDATGTPTLWSTDGTGSGTQVIHAADGAAVPYPSQFTPIAQVALFSAADGAGGYGLWRTDGTSVGTYQLHVANAGPDAAGSYGLSPQGIVSLGGTAVFAGNDAAGHDGLWVSDGTAAGTVELAPAGASATAFNPLSFTAIGTRAVFEATDATGQFGVWSTDGTSAGTQEIAAGLYSASYGFTSNGSRALFDGTRNGQTALYITDGTAAGTTELTAAGAPASGLDATGLTTNGSTFLFSAPNAAGMDEIWSSDGTSAGTVAIAVAPSSAVGPVDITPVVSPALYLANLTVSVASGTTLRPGSTVQFTLATNQAVTVSAAGGGPSLTLGNGAAASYQPALSTGNQLVFGYTAATGQDTADLKVAALALNGSAITDSAGDPIAATALSGFSTADTGIAVSSSAAPVVPAQPTSPSTPASPVLPLHIIPPTPSIAATGILTNSATPALSGTAIASSTVTLLDGTVIVGTTTVSAAGTWTATLSGLPAGVQQITAVATGPSFGSTPVSAPVTVVSVAAPIAGISTADIASIDVGSALGHGFTAQFVPGTQSVQLLDGAINAGTGTDAAYVARLFLALGGTVPGGSGIGEWTDYLASGHSRGDVAGAFLSSPQGQGLAALSDPAFINALFTNVLSRPPSAAELGSYTTLLAAGATRAEVLFGISASAEAQAADAPATTGLWVPSPARQAADLMFQVGLGREPTAAVVQPGAAGLLGGLTPLQYAAEIASTPEFTARHAGETPAAFVTDLYQTGLGRAPTAPELGFDTTGLQSGAFTQSAILAAVGTSAEAAAALTRPI